MTAAERLAREERMKAREAMLPTLDRLGKGERLSVEERAELDTANKAISELESEIRTYEVARELSAASAAADAPAPEVSGSEARERDFSNYLRTGRPSMELRAAGESTNGGGGFLVPPGWFQRLQIALKAYGGTAEDFEQLVTESGQPMVWATVDPTTTVGQLVGSANTTGANSQTPGSGSGSAGANENFGLGDVDFVFGQGNLSAYMYTSGVQKTSIQLANDSAFDVDSFVSARVGESLGRAKAQAAISGTGTSQPAGIIPSLSAWAATSPTSGGFVSLVSGGGAAVPQTAAGTDLEVATNTLAPTTLRRMIAAIDPAYRALGAKFYVNDTQLLGLRGQVDSNGRPLINLQDGLSEGEPTTLWGYGIKVDQNTPNLSTSAQVGGATAGVGGPVFGHLASAMLLRTVNQSGLLSLHERYADLLQVGWIGYMRFDIRPNDLRAAVTVKSIA